jgi:osmoprotectant transport system permease protein
MCWRLTAAVWVTFTLSAGACHVSHPFRVGSKQFTESVILGELAAQLAQMRSPHVVHMKELGGTRVLWQALVSGEIDLYPEYTGTLVHEIFAGRQVLDEKDLASLLAEKGIGLSASLGFDDSYALGMKESLARQLDIHSISDLRGHPALRFGFSNEFMDRHDGWASLRLSYQLPQKNVTGLEHQLGYQALDSDAIAVTDLYSTDADILYYHVRVLEDDKRFFPEYKAVFLFRQELLTRAPEALRSLLRLQGAISRSDMITMNKDVKIGHSSADEVAAAFLRNKYSISAEVRTDTLVERLLLRTRQHLFLVSISLIAAILISIPLGVVAFLYGRVGQIVLSVVGIMQTIPSLALIVLMIPLLGIGDAPAIMALFLYSLLPIVRNTHSGLADVPAPVRESAEALGLPRLARLKLIELPLASRSIVSGVKTSAVINVGTATLGALIGAGGYGQPIFTGIRLSDTGQILEGAVPAALMALLVQAIFDRLETVLVPKGLQGTDLEKAR